MEIKKFKEFNESVNSEIIIPSNIKLPFSEDEYNRISIGYYDSGNVYNDGKYYSEVPSYYENFKVLKYLKDTIFSNIRPKLCDMGCGSGGVVSFSKKIGYESIGIEYQKQLKKYHDELDINVIYGDFFKMDLSFLKNMNLIYLYRPIKDEKLCDKLLELIYENTKKDVIILYYHPPVDRSKLFEYTSIKDSDDGWILKKIN